MVCPLKGMMRRWMAGLILATACLFATVATAQEQWAPPGATQAGFHAGMLPGPPQPQQWHQRPDGGSMSAETMYHLVPADRAAIYDQGSPFDGAFDETLGRAIVRLDYLLWNLNRPGDVLLGAPITGVNGFGTANVSARDMFFIQDRRTTRINVLGQVPSLDGVSQNNLNGIRGTLSIPFVNGTLEGDVWGLSKSEYSFFQPATNFSADGSVANTFPFIAVTSLTADGVVVPDSVILYNQDYAAHLSTRLMGTEVNWIRSALTPNQAGYLAPTIGFRYIRLYDELLIAGSDIPDPINDPTTILNHRIDSKARNDIFGPQFGLKSETNLGHITLGVEPKVLIGLNRARDSVDTQQLFSATEDPRNDYGSKNRFAPAFDLSLYARWHPTPRLSFRVGYDLLVVANVSRSFNNIRYDAAAAATGPPNVSLRSQTETLIVQGLVLGGEYTFR